MRRSTSPCVNLPVCLASFLALCLLPLSALAQDPGALFNAYLAGSWKANPGLATRAGVHEYDALLPDLSAPAMQAEIARNHDFLAQFERVSQGMSLRVAQGQTPGAPATPPGAASPASRADLEVVLDHIRLTLFQLEEMRTWKTRPDLLVTALSDSVRDLVVRAFAPADRRFEAADARLKQLPKALRALRGNFDAVASTPARPVRAPAVAQQTAVAPALQPSEYSTRTAIALSQATASFIEKTVPQAAAEQGSNRKTQQRVERDSAAAAAAFRDFAQWLESALLPVSKGVPFLAPEPYARWFRYYLAIDETPDSLLKAAEADLAETREQMRVVAESIGPGKTLAEVLESLAQDHPTPQTIVSAYQTAASQARRFVDQKKLVPLPRSDRFRIERAPAGFPADEATLDVPGPFEPDLNFYLYSPNLDRLGLEAGDRVLLENDPSSVQMVAVHELFPGHYVQLDLMNRAGNLPQKVFANPAFVSGWAQYCEQMVLEEGFASEAGEPGPSRLRLVQLFRALRGQAAAIADIGLHTGIMNAGEAVKLLSEQGLQSRERAEEQVREIALNPSALAADYAGKRSILRLREELRKKQGPAFILREFHEQLISLGAPPLPAAREIMLDALNRLGK
jgi:uncharacterized protein (DUF885 family)